MSESGSVAEYLRGECPVFCAHVDGTLTCHAAAPTVLLPGSFNPLHAGHLRLAEVAAALVDATVDFELSVVNVDKPPLSMEEVQRRLAQFHGRGRVWVTRAPTFEEKALLFPGTAFIIGADTARRLIALRYYAGEERRMNESLARIRDRGCRFLVAGREDEAGRFIAVEDLDVPAAARDLFAGIPKSLFHMPVSSTGLRGNSR